MTNFYRKCIRYLAFCLALVLFLSSEVMAQSRTISGTVTSGDEQEPIPGANIIIQGANTGTVTNSDGTYSIEVPGNDAVLIFSFVGYLSNQVTVGNQTTINVELIPDIQTLSEIVVVGYGTQKRAEVTGAISSIDAEDLNVLPIATADQALQGRAAGVSVINSGSPGTAPVVRIRGLGTMNNNEPLYVIDGVIASGLGDINAADIESVQILKDASTTAVYGSKGSNGVVMITTKKGSVGQIRVNFDSYVGSQWTDKRLDLMNTEQYVQYAREIGGPPRVTDPQYQNFLNTDTDWQEEIFRSGLLQNYNLGVSGGTENSNYRISAGYINQEGTLLETSFERYNFRANSEFNVGKLKIGETLSASFGKQLPEKSAGGRSVIEHTIKAAPYFPVYNSNNLGGFQGPNTSLDGQDAENPVRVLLLGDAVNRNINLLGSIYGELEIIDGLRARTQVGLDYTSFVQDRFTPSYDDDSEGSTHSSNRAVIAKNTGTYQSVIFTNSLNYTKTLADKHNFEVLLLHELTQTRNANINATSNNYITNEVKQLSPIDASINSFELDYNRLGYLARINYNYDGKYIFAASMRRDASTRFGPNNRWGSFPSIAAGWRISEESFLTGVDLISNLKLRASWGVTGNDNIGNYSYSTTITDNFIYPINNEAAVGATPSGLANPNLKWEETTMFNIGADIGLMDDQITFAIEYYSNTSDDLLMPRPLSPSLGFNSSFFIENVGSVETSGFEMQLGYNDHEGDFQWSANLNLSTTKNEVISLGVNESLSGGGFENQNISRVEVGQPLFYFYGFVTDGIFQTQGDIDAHAEQANAQPGDIRFQDLAGPPDANGNPTGPDGVIDANDRTLIGNPFPDLTYGLNLNASYMNFDLNIFINGVSGNEIYNTNIYDLEGMPRLFNGSPAVLDRWTGPGTSNDLPRALGATENLNISDRFVEDGSFTRLRNITLGYNFPTDLFRDKISKLRFYISGQNLITLTDYSGYDPEIGVYTVAGGAPTIGLPATNGTGQPTANFATGIDRGNYPQPKSVLVGLQVTF